MIESLLAGLAPKEVKELLASTDVDGYSPMHRAAYNGRHAMLRYLILHGAANCVHARTSEGWTPLHSAARWGQVEIARLLLANGADINAATEGRQTPLHLAAAQVWFYCFIALLYMYMYIHCDFLFLVALACADVWCANKEKYE